MWKHIRVLVGPCAIVLLFVLSWYLCEIYEEQLKHVLSLGGWWGMGAYVALTVISVVLAPVNTLFLMPVASMMWGPFMAALLSIAGWAIGGVGAYALARRWGRPVVAHMVGEERLEGFAQRVPERFVFWWVVGLRMAVSVDVLSYALGVLVPMSYTSYTLATLLGVTPFAFVFAYSTTLPFAYLVAVLTFALGMSVLGARLFMKPPGAHHSSPQSK